MSKRQEFITAEHVCGKPTTYHDKFCGACGVNILEYCKETGNKVHATSGGKSATGTKYRCYDCWQVIYGGVSVR